MEEFRKPDRPLGGRTITGSQHEYEADALSGRNHDQHISDKLEKKFSVSAETLRRWMADLNSEEFIDIYKEYLVKSGVDTSRLNMPDHIYFMQSERHQQSYSPIENSLNINLKYFDKEIREADSDMNVKAAFIRGFA